jgi:O-antigen ligase
LTHAADVLATVVAVSLPWSTSVTAIAAVVWLVVALATLKLPALRDEFVRPAGGLPALLAVFGLLATLWADVPWPDRWGGVDSFARLLLIPVLLAQFRGSGRAKPVLAGFFVSCTALLLLSGLLVLWPALGRGWLKDLQFGVPVKDYIAQSGEFVLCAFALGPLVVAAARDRRWALAAGLLALALGFLANVLYVATGRTALAVIPVLGLIFCLRQFSWRSAIAALAAAVLAAALVWASSPYLRTRVGSLVREIQTYEASNARTSAGERLEYWKKSIGFVAEAPLIGHGTGAIHDLFRRSTAGLTGPGDEAAANPHNQTFAVALQTGLIGTALLYGMWMAHLLLFRGGRLVAWIGLVVVVQNIVGSLFNSHLFDFTQAWMYIFGIGAAGGMVLPPLAGAAKRPAPKAAREVP